MAIIETRVDRNSPEFQENTHYLQQQLALLRERIQLVQEGGGEDAIAKHRKRNKLLAREHIQLQCDADTPTVELTALRARHTDDYEPAAAGNVNGAALL